jgi:hypothetical protein
MESIKQEHRLRPSLSPIKRQSNLVRSATGEYPGAHNKKTPFLCFHFFSETLSTFYVVLTNCFVL